MQTAIKSHNLFKQRIVSDYSSPKAPFYLSGASDEFTLFHTMYQMMAAQLRPEVVAILDPSVNDKANRPARTRMSKIFQTTTSMSGQSLQLLLPSPSRISGRLG